MGKNTERRREKNPLWYFLHTSILPCCDTAPLHPYTPTPLHHCTPAPLHPYNPAPLHPYTPKPLHPCTPAPLHQYTTVPLHTACFFMLLHTFILTRSTYSTPKNLLCYTAILLYLYTHIPIYPYTR
jgi:hypothetical protein